MYEYVKLVKLITSFFFSYLISTKSQSTKKKSNHNQPRLKLPTFLLIYSQFKITGVPGTKFLGITEAATSISHLVSEFYQSLHHRDVHHSFMSLIFYLFVPLIAIILYNTIQ